MSFSAKLCGCWIGSCLLLAIHTELNPADLTNFDSLKSFHKQDWIEKVLVISLSLIVIIAN